MCPAVAGCAARAGLAGDVQDRVRFVRLLLQLLDSLGRREDEQFDLATHSFTLHFFHDWQCARAGTDHKPPAFPGNLFLDGQRRVSKGVAELFGRFFLALTNSSAIDHDVMFVGNTINADRTEGEILEAHTYLRRHYTLGGVAD